jgi:uncharacterized protein (DUF983 family)
MDAQESDERRRLGPALVRGAVGRCPRCGTGPLFRGYLAVVDRCAACGHDLGAYRAADGPAFFTISVVGLSLVPLLGFGFAAYRPDPVTLLVWTAAIATVLTLVLLRVIKGAFVGFLWARRERDPWA